jgi:hypothetical protein
VGGDLGSHEAGDRLAQLLVLGAERRQDRPLPGVADDRQPAASSASGPATAGFAGGRQSSIVV